MFVLGDFTTSDTLYLPFDTYDSNGASVTITGLAVTDIEIYKDGSVTQRASDNGYALLDTDGIDFDGVTGLHGFSVDLSDNSDAGFYAAGSQYWINVNAITVDSQTVRFTYYFTIGRLLKPTTAGRTLDVTATGAAGIDWANVENPSTAVDLSATDIQLCDTLTTNNDKTGYSVSAAVASFFQDFFTVNSGEVSGSEVSGSAILETAKVVWDRILSGATHNIGSSAGRRLRQIQESGAIYNGQVWVDTVNGVAGTTPYENGTSDNHVDLWASAITIAPNVNGGLLDFHIINGSSVDFTGAAVDNYSIFGNNYTIALGGVSCQNLYVEGAMVSGVGTAAAGEMHFEGCDISTLSVQSGHFDFCSFGGTVTHTLAGDYNYHNCYSGVAGTNGPTFAKTAGQAITAQWRGWKGSINLTGLEVGDTLTIGGLELGTIDLGSPAGAVVVEIRGIYKELVNIGSAVVNLDGAINAADVALIAYEGPRGPGVYLNDAAANTNTVNGRDGTLASPVSTIASAKTIADSLSLDRIYLINDSFITLAATMEDYEFVGIGEMSANTVNFGSQDVDQAVFYNLLLTGAQGGTGRCQAEGCVLSAITGMEITGIDVLLAAGTLTLRNDCAFLGWSSAVAGSGTPVLNINSVANVNVYMRHGSGGIQINNAVATTVMSVETDGQLIVDATCTGLTVVPRGNLSVTDNGTSTTLDPDAAISRTGIRSAVGLAAANLDTQLTAIVGDTNELQTDWTNGGRLDLLLDAIPTTPMRGTEGANTTVPDAAGTAATLHGTTDALVTTVDTVVDAIKVVTDALTAASAAKLALSAGTIPSGAAVAGTLSTTQMTTDLTEATDDHYNGRSIVWTSGVLTDQATDITGYTGATKLLTFTAVTEAPSATDAFVIV